MHRASQHRASYSHRASQHRASQHRASQHRFKSASFCKSAPRKSAPRKTAPRKSAPRKSASRKYSTAQVSTASRQHRASQHRTLICYFSMPTLLRSNFYGTASAFFAVYLRSKLYLPSPSIFNIKFNHFYPRQKLCIQILPLSKLRLSLHLSGL